MEWINADDLRREVEKLELEGEITKDTADTMCEIANKCIASSGVATWQWQEIRKNSVSVLYVQCSHCKRTNRTRMSNFCPFCGSPMVKEEK